MKRYGMNTDKLDSFTIIELLISITIIGTIIAFSLFAYSNVGKLARDAKRKSDLEQLRAALEQYKSVNGNYPKTDSGYSNWWGTCTVGSTIVDNTNGADGYIPALVPSGYLPKLPHDPRELKSQNCGVDTIGNIRKDDGTSVCYIYKSDGANYKIVSLCGPESVNPTTIINDPYFDPKRPGTNSDNIGFQVSSNNDARTNW